MISKTTHNIKTKTFAISDIVTPIVLYLSSYLIIYISGIAGSGMIALVISVGIPTALYAPIAILKIKKLLNEIT